ncbi:hypothetical protein M514_03413 [Trichuris suis]|uniref:Phosphorylase b kinase regulatory subunit n=1 Tax=Trichuris suis TaxID=68888 RepID=A0A085NF30_9BILA|nr:hypothetical protein M514_03413 [Trichuris suis]
MDALESLVEAHRALTAEARRFRASRYAVLLSNAFEADSSDQASANKQQKSSALEELLICLLHPFAEEVPESFRHLIYSMLFQPQMAFLDCLRKLFDNYYAAQGFSAALLTKQNAPVSLRRREELTLAKMENDLFQLIEKPSRAYLDLLNGVANKLQEMGVRSRLIQPAVPLVEYLGGFEGLKWAAEQFDLMQGVPLSDSVVATKLKEYASLKHRIAELEKRVTGILSKQQTEEYARQANSVAFDVSRLESSTYNTFVMEDIVAAFVETLFPWKVIESSALSVRLRSKDLVFCFSRGKDWTDFPSEWTVSFDPSILLALSAAISLPRTYLEVCPVYQPLEELERNFWTSFCHDDIVSDCTKFKERFPRVDRFPLVLSSLQKLIESATVTLEEFVQVLCDHHGTRLVDSALIVPLGDGKELTFKVDITNYPNVNSVKFDAKNKFQRAEQVMYGRKKVRQVFHSKIMQKSTCNILITLFGCSMSSEPTKLDRLNYYTRAVYKTILIYTDPVTGLFCSPVPSFKGHAWVRDNICIKVMRSLLTCFMGQASKVEAFKKSQSPKDALHAKYSARHLRPIVGDQDWGHLQIDAISIYLLTLAQMTASGLQVVFSLDEVAFVQNLVFYIEHAYRIPDYGIWERGDKTNHGVPELNATSIGMAKAALQALNGLDLFGSYGSPSSVIHVMTDEIEQCDAVLRSLLPRESYSKETDAGLLSIISYPAFAVGDPSQISTTRVTIVDKLQGKYGCRRFLRDGYRTPREDPNRLYYEPYELQKFENLECEWPLFFCYLFIDAHFNNNHEKAKFYRNCLDQVVIKGEDDLLIVPELYALSEENVDAEIREPHSQERFPTGAAPFLWAQSLYILGCLIEEGLIKLAEMDPLNRRLSTDVRPDTVVQVAVLAEDEDVRSKLAAQGIDVELVANAEPFVVLPAHILGRMYAQMGRNAKMNLTGRRSMDVGLLSTSKMYIVENRIFVFTPQFLDWSRFYLTHDLNILIDTMKSELLYVKTTWNVPGRPLVVFVFSSAMVTDVDPEMRNFLSGILHGPQKPTLALLLRRKSVSQEQAKVMPAYVRGISQRHKSIVLDPNDVALIKLRINGGPESRRSSTGRDERQTSEDISDVTPRASPEREEVLVVPAPLLRSPSIERVSSEARPRSPTNKQASLTLLSFLRTCPYRYADYAKLNEVQCTELVDMLLETDLLDEQADIVLYLWAKKGPDWNTRLGGRANVPVRRLVEEIYDKASRERCWWLVRYTAGLLKKVTENLTNAVTALLIRQKQITIGMPTIYEERIVSPLLPEELLKLIRKVIGEDECGIMITQEVLIYLGMFIRTEPHLFTEMLRLRVGLIIQVMISELARGLRISGEEAATQVTNLSPYELKTLLHHILSGKEMSAYSDVIEGSDENTELITYTAKTKAEKTGILRLQKQLKQRKMFAQDTEFEDMNPEQSINWLQWLRRRRIDGALNRVPPDFYSRIWRLLRTCEGVIIGGQVLHRNLTQEMTTGEYKFALTVESVLNKIPDPEYRQLMVEVMMVLTLVNESHTNLSLGTGLVNADNIVRKANEIFLADQKAQKGDAMACCCTEGKKGACGGAYGICKHFYDSPPSGRYGTITYMCRGVVCLVPQLGEEIECSVS